MLPDWLYLFIGKVAFYLVFCWLIVGTVLALLCWLLDFEQWTWPPRRRGFRTWGEYQEHLRREGKLPQECVDD